MHSNNKTVIARSEATKQSTLSFVANGLLRFARNDAEMQTNNKEYSMTSFARGFIGAALLAGLLAAPAQAQEVKAGDLVITQAWSRATPGGAKIAGGYLTIENKGSAPDRLIGGSGDVADKIEVHEMAMNNGVMTMRPLDKGLTIEPGKTVKLAPGGYHLMLFDLKSPLKQGDKVPVTLEFEKAGKVKLSLDVEGIGAQGPSGANSSGGNMDMKKMPDRPGTKM
jgi:periplasmic copper chaperone A